MRCRLGRRPDGQITSWPEKGLSSLFGKNISLFQKQQSGVWCISSRLCKRGVRPIVTERKAGCGGREGNARRALPFAYGEIAWSRPPDAEVKLVELVRGRRGQQSMAPRGERDINRKAIRAGDAGLPPLHLYARVRVPLAQMHARPRVQRAPGIPCALFIEDSMKRGARQATLGRTPPRERKDVSCWSSLTLAMTALPA